MPGLYQDILQEYTKEIEQLLKNHLKAVILYGSYARGDFTQDSDIDIMILTDLPDEEAKKYFKLLADMTYDINLDNDILIMPTIKNQEHFEQWKQAYPFYANVSKEGVKLYAS